ncbi:outer membrane protein assembly factor [Motilimonas cestriensis]|uniref:Outer membrane protein assembly factor n=1 Tax=Motilimonas cestriensis TaxID=2742685 RepID=A0ABS8W684_9GAMM|nr:BamA/TamA family outer membrane protein [Motilimonas cestriensis]MCE2593882.1 outer membrane protein assembly factor [Motilimonas cestriensis]
MRLTLITLFVFTAPCWGIEDNSNTYSYGLDSFTPEWAENTRSSEYKFKVQKGDFVAVPIPMSDPTLGSGIVGVAAYYYGQTEQEKQQQPPNVTQFFSMYTDNKSYGVGINQQNYWQQDKWRFNATLAYADLRLDLLDENIANVPFKVGWQISGIFAKTQLLRSVADNWYLGIQAKWIENEQTFSTSLDRQDWLFASQTQSIGAGALLQYDSRDNQTNAYNGQRFELDAMFNDQALGSTNTYQSYQIRYRFYKQLLTPLIFAFEARGCNKKGNAPLWDYCTIGLRGFSATNYLDKTSVSSQAELRWRAWKSLGFVGFAGAGEHAKTINSLGEHDAIASYGVGIRYMVLESQRINLRVDYAKSNDDDAVYLSVTEAF